jgi:hypothetical protein
MDRTCTNCGADKHGEFCAVCGQNSRDYLRSAFRVGYDFLTEVFDVDGRLFRTLGYLLAKPGYLSREFTLGRRARYVSPGRLYLLISLTFFFVLSLTGGDVTIDSGSGAELSASLREDPELQRIFQRLPTPERERVEKLLRERGVDVETVFDGAIEAAPEADPTVSSALEQKLLERGIGILEDPQQAYQNVLGNLPFAMFVMLPLLAVFMKIFYPGHFYAEHLVFSLHLHSFVFIVFTVLALTPSEVVAQSGELSHANPWEWLDGTLLLVCYGYGYLALRRVSGQSWAITLGKYAALSMLYGIVLSIGLAAVVVTTLLLG